MEVELALSGAFGLAHDSAGIAATVPRDLINLPDLLFPLYLYRNWEIDRKSGTIETSKLGQILMVVLFFNSEILCATTKKMITFEIAHLGS